MDMISYLIVGNNVDLAAFPFRKPCRIIGVDAGAYKALKAGLSLDLAYGDFDSVTPEQLDYIKQHAKAFKALNPIKDITDTYGAYLEAGNSEAIVVVGGIAGPRIEHFLALLNLVKADPRVELIDDKSLIRQLPSSPKAYSITAERGPYFSIFAIVESRVSLSGFAYPLQNYLLQPLDSLGVSNELRDPKKPGTILVASGAVLLVCSHSDHCPL